MTPFSNLRPYRAAILELKCVKLFLKSILRIYRATLFGPYRQTLFAPYNRPCSVFFRVFPVFFHVIGLIAFFRRYSTPCMFIVRDYFFHFLRFFIFWKFPKSRGLSKIPGIFRGVYKIISFCNLRASCNVF